MQEGKGRVETMELPPTIGRYRVRGVLGSGGFGTVFHAVDEALDDDVAIKVLAENWSYDPDVRARFISEARLMRSIDSEVVVRVFDIGETQGQPFFVMPLAERGTLDDRLIDGEAVPLADVRRVVVTVAAALRVLHAAGVVHRDVKPANLLVRADARNPTDGSPPGGLLGSDERLMLADFGLAKDVLAASGLTVNAGTPGYVAPEQAEPGAAVDARVDVFAAAALVCRLWTGSVPSGGDEPLDEGQRGLLGAAAPTLVRGLRLDPAARPADIDAWEEEMLRAIDRELEEPLAHAGYDSAAAVAPGVAASEPVAAPGTSRRRVLVAGVVGLAAVVGGGVALLGDDAAAVGPVIGPSAVPVGATGVYTAMPQRLLGDDRQAAQVTWIDWNGTRVGDASFLVRPSSTGSLTFTLEVVTADGETVTHEQRVRVVDAGAVGAVIGPSEIPVGGTGIFTLDPAVIDSVSPSWTDAAGVVSTASSYFVQPSSAGSVRFTVDANGAEPVEHRIRAVE